MEIKMNCKKIFLLILIIPVFGFITISCSDDTSEFNIITITNIVGRNNYWSGILIFSNANNINSDPIAEGYGYISNGSVNFLLEDLNGNLWTGSGSYHILFGIHNSNNDTWTNYVYTNGGSDIKYYKISDAVTEISLNKFREY